eukprot:TRINITY_DN5578_c0_g2_i6.p1 TRINITY_DN5578_c0_g2~~TRINITY_DN5578_c0_g2_i6.p1  ORF type:complete len:317 (+),score=62.33 TRINITY_DN5578_c0_g2_i6:188-1138(+)
MEKKKSEYTLVKNIVKFGALGVMIDLCKDENRFVVIKQYKPRSRRQKEKILELLQNEVNSLQRLNAHTFIAVKLVDHSINENTHRLVLEYLPNGTLHNFINNLVKYKVPLDENLTRKLFLGMLILVYSIHNNGVVHLDLKPENVMFNEDGELRLIDFGHSAILSSRTRITRTDIGTTPYLAPEVAKDLVAREEGKEENVRHKIGYVGRAADVYSLGIVLFAIHFRTLPFGIANEVDKGYAMIVNEEYEKFWQEVEKITLVHLSEGLKKLITAMILYKPEERLTVSEIGNFPWVQLPTIETREILKLLTMFNEGYST